MKIIIIIILYDDDDDDDYNNNNNNSKITNHWRAMAVASLSISGNEVQRVTTTIDRYCKWLATISGARSTIMALLRSTTNVHWSWLLLLVGDGSIVQRSDCAQFFFNWGENWVFFIFILGSNIVNIENNGYFQIS